MGAKADDIFQSFSLSTEEQKKYDTVVTCFQDHFIACWNMIFGRVTFNSCVQGEGKTTDSFITSLYGLAKHCGFGNLHDEQICDRIVVGIWDTSLSEKLQMDPKLDLQKAINTMHQSEAVKMQQAAIRGRAITTDKAIDALHKTRHLQKGQG